jgi:hypothetical protein
MMSFAMNDRVFPNVHGEIVILAVAYLFPPMTLLLSCYNGMIFLVLICSVAIPIRELIVAEFEHIRELEQHRQAIRPQPSP